jgi:hypothetical protein
MTTWNYRVIKKTCAHSLEVTYQIHEVYYLKDGSIDCWNHAPVEPLGISEPSLRNDIQSFLAAFRQPILEERFINGKAKLVAERITKHAGDLQADYVSKTSRASGYINQILGNHLLLKQEPALRQAYDKVDQALMELNDIVDSKLYAAEV